MPRGYLLFLVILNTLVLMGQVWPAGAPRFARGVNIVFLGLSLGTFAWLLYRRSRR